MDKSRRRSARIIARNPSVAAASTLGGPPRSRSALLAGASFAALAAFGARASLQRDKPDHNKRRSRYGRRQRRLDFRFRHGQNHRPDRHHRRLRLELLDHDLEQ